MKAHVGGGAEGRLREGGVVARFLRSLLLRRARGADEKQRRFRIARGPHESRNRRRRGRRQGDQEKVLTGGGGEQVADAEHQELAGARPRDGLRRPPRPDPLQRAGTGTHFEPPLAINHARNVGAKPHRRCGSA